MRPGLHAARSGLFGGRASGHLTASGPASVESGRPIARIADDNAMAEAWVAAFKRKLVRGSRCPSSENAGTRGSTGSVAATGRGNSVP